MAAQSNVYSIGRFAKMGGISIKQLRYLDEKGILKPSVRNAGNNYRYYSEKQLGVLVFVKNLRGLGMPFDDIVRVLQSDDPATLVQTLKGNLREAERQVRQVTLTYERNTSYLIQLLKGHRVLNEVRIARECAPGSDSSDIRIVDVPARYVIYTRYRSRITAHDLFVQRFTELLRMCEEQIMIYDEGMAAVFHGCYQAPYAGQTEDLETFFPLRGSLPASGSIRVFGGFQAVSAIHIGRHTEMTCLYRSMLEWADQRNISLMPQGIEQYILGPDMTVNPDHYVTQLLLPLEGSVL